MKNTSASNKVIKTAIMAMLTALSVVSVYALRLPLIPAAPFLEYDAADIPVLIGSMLLGPVSGIVTLLAVCAIQALTVSASSGWIGFVMHLIASGVLVLISSTVYKKKPTSGGLVLGLVLGSLAMTAVMIPLNLVFTGIFLGAGTKAVAQMLIPAIIPFNLLKAGINSAVTFAVFTPISHTSPVFRKIGNSYTRLFSVSQIKRSRVLLRTPAKQILGCARRGLRL